MVVEIGSICIYSVTPQLRNYEARYSAAISFRPSQQHCILSFYGHTLEWVKMMQGPYQKSYPKCDFSF